MFDVFVYVCEYVPVTGHMCIHIAQVHIWKSTLNIFLNFLPPCFLRDSLLLNLELANLANGYPASPKYIPIPAFLGVGSRMCLITPVLIF